jgi:predicted RecA/RadA family phage recombinase
MKNFLGKGEVMNFVAGATLTGGSPLVINGMFGVIVANAVSGETAALYVGPGIVSLPKAATITPANGALLYWDATNSNVTTTSSGNRLIGTAALPVAAAADTTLAVRLDAVAR